MLEPDQPVCVFTALIYYRVVHARGCTLEFGTFCYVIR